MELEEDGTGWMLMMETLQAAGLQRGALVMAPQEPTAVEAGDVAMCGPPARGKPGLVRTHSPPSCSHAA